VSARGEDGTVRLTAHASKASVTVGEAFEVRVEASGPPGASYAFPAEAAGETSELRSLVGAATPAPPTNQHLYEARVYALGDVALPSLTVKYRLADGAEGEASVAGPTVKVGSLLPKDPQEQGLADIVGPVRVRVAPVFWVALSVGILLLAIAGWLIWRRLRRPAAQVLPAPEPERPPAEEALRALDLLARAGHFARGDGRGYYIDLALIAKRYLERRLGAPVVEMTSAEMLAYLRDSPHAAELLAPMRDVVLAADQVKFARGEALREEGERHLAAVRTLLERLEERLRPKPAADASGKAA
jgi:hypothetical protein